MSDQKQKEALKNALIAIKQLRAELETYRRAEGEPIALVGMGCRFPGGVQSPEDFWQLLARGGDAITEVPADRWDSLAYYDPNPGNPGKMYVRKGGFLDGIRGFDASFFGISPREALGMDPQQRILLEVTWEALEHAGIRPSELMGSRTGVFVGQVATDYADRRFKAVPDSIDAYCGTGTYPSVLSGRLSFHLGLQGPSVTIDTACSTSLVAVHQAVQSLRSRECDTALAGGVNLLLSPNHHIYYCELRALAPDGRCKAFDAEADGFVKAEGCGVIVLKRLSDARKAGDPILALLRGSATGHDGRSSGLTVPNGPAQEAVIRGALRAAGLDGTDIDFIEAHGTGTTLGDPIEVSALLATLRADSEKPLVLGSVKTNIGHTESAAGVAGLIKSVLALQHRAIPANLHFQSLNPRIEPGRVPLRIPTEQTAWESDAPRRVGVSSIGISGTNAHVILEEAPEREDTVHERKSPALLTLSARGGSALEAQAERWIHFLEDPRNAGLSLPEAARSAALYRDHHNNRLALVAADRAEAVATLRTLVQGGQSENLVRGRRHPDRRHALVFYYPGQGSQWLGMGRRLMADEPVFRDKVAACDALCRELEGWSLIDELEADETTSRLAETAVTQPLIFTMQVALTELLASWGIRPSSVIGHSMGEVAAAHVADALSLEDAVRVICARSRIVKAAGLGAMAMVELSAEEAEAAVAPHAGSLSVASHNGPRTTILSGEVAAMDTLLAELEGRNVFCRRVNVDYASHSAHMDPLREAILSELASVRPRATSVRLYSTALGKIVSGDEMDAAYWADNLRNPVLFHEMITASITDGHTGMIELSPHPVLTYAVRESVAAAESDALTHGCLRRDEDERAKLLTLVGALHCAGHDIDFAAILGKEGGPVRIPTYAWHRADYWIEATPQSAPSIEPVSRGPIAVRLADLDRDPALVETFDRLTQEYGLASLTIGQATGKQLVFFSAERDALCFFNRRKGSLVAINYTGPEESFGTLLRQLHDHAKRYDLQLDMILEHDRYHDTLAEQGFSATPFGIWHEVHDIAGYSLDGKKKRRLRYAVSRYVEAGEVAVSQHVFGTDPETDKACFAIMEDWAERKVSAVALVARIREDLESGRTGEGSHERAYLIERDGVVEGVILLSPSNEVNGYLMDMEFYRKDVPMGCMEYGIVEIMRRLAEEGRETLSLGLTLGTGLHETPNEDPEVRAFLETLHQEGLLNGDGNAQFKNKFRPENRPAWLIRPRGSDPDSLHVILEMLGDPLNTAIDESFEDELWGAGQNRPIRLSPQRPPHPLLHEALDLAGHEAFYITDLDVATAPWLDQHRVWGMPIFPAAGMFEMATAAAALNNQPARLVDVILTQPLTLAEPARVQLALRPERGGRAELAVYSKVSGHADWRAHLEGFIEHDLDVREPAPIDLESVKARTTLEIERSDFYAEKHRSGYGYGPSFQGLAELFVGEGESLGRVASPADLDAREYGVHPAVLDACLQAGLHLVNVLRPERFHLPLGLSAFTVHAEGEPAWAHARALEMDELVSVDLTVTDERGRVLMTFREMSFREADPSIMRQALLHGVSDGFATVEWQDKARDERVATTNDGAWLIYDDESPLADAIISALIEKGFACTRVRAGERAEQPGLLTIDPDATEDHRWIRDRLEGQTPHLLWLWRHQEPAVLCGRLLAALATHAGTPGEGRVWMTTRGAIGCQGTAPTDPAAACVWAMGRVFASEHEEQWGGLIEVDDRDPVPLAPLLVTELTAPDTERQLAFRDNRRLVPRLTPREAGTDTPTYRDGTWLITGGLGALGLAHAEHLAGRGITDLVLLGRRAPGHDASEAIARMESGGTRVHVRAADVTDREDLERIFAEIRADLPVLRGVIHAAGILDDGLLEGQTPERVARVLAPKVEGARHLDALTREDDLDGFALFSSAAALLGTPGQVGYVAGNAYMDALAEQRRAAGLPATSIAWGAWGEIGLMASMGAREKELLLARGPAPFPTEVGLAAFDRALVDPRGHLAFCPMDAERLAATPLGAQPYCEPIVGTSIEVPEDVSVHTVLSIQAFREAGLEARRSMVVDYLVGRIAIALGAAADDVDTATHLTNMGVSSLMIMELRNHIRSELGINIPAVKFFRHPDIARLAEDVVEMLAETVGDGMTEAETEPEPKAEAAPEIGVDNMSDEEVDDLLARMLAEQGGEA